MPTLRALQGRRVQSDLNHYFGGNHFCGAIDLFAFYDSTKGAVLQGARGGSCKYRVENRSKNDNSLRRGRRKSWKTKFSCKESAENVETHRRLLYNLESAGARRHCAVLTPPISRMPFRFLRGFSRPRKSAEGCDTQFPARMSIPRVNL